MQQENRLARALECAKCGQASIKVRCSLPAEVSKLLRPFSFVVEGGGGGVSICSTVLASTSMYSPSSYNGPFACCVPSLISVSLETSKIRVVSESSESLRSRR